MRAISDVRSGWDATLDFDLLGSNIGVTIDDPGEPFSSDIRVSIVDIVEALSTLGVPGLTVTYDRSYEIPEVEGLYVFDDVALVNAVVYRFYAEQWYCLPVPTRTPGLVLGDIQNEYAHGRTLRKLSTS